jgi:NADH:ubiquinone reductase (H+-translocating)
MRHHDAIVIGTGQSGPALARRLGRKRAVAQLGRLRLSGFIAWTLWSVAHIYYLIGFRNRLVVAMNWALHYVTFQRGARLITGISGSRIEVLHAADVVSASKVANIPRALRN